ncbi:DUF1161 domain-containing protein [Noviherbaspirillum sp. ST9]|uniref:DUF1161 domain-containing protein n=1 Tax=Noviherbaspirillum sp. ST9 TaxID=3401606 RepID=UPI003B58A693
MNKLEALAVLTLAAAFGTPVAASDDCASVKKSIEAKMSANGVKDVTLTVVDKDAKVSGKQVGQCDRKKRKIVYAAGRPAMTPPDKNSPDAKIAQTSKVTVDAKAAAAARAASEAASAEAKAASAASLAAEAKAAANKAAAEARAAAIEARTAAETRAMAAAKVAAEAKVQADAAANEAISAADAKVAADAWAATAAKAASDAAAAAAKAASDARAAAEIKTAAQARAATAAQKAASEARVAATARAAANAIVIDPADIAGMLAAAGAVEASAAIPRPAADARTTSEPRTPAVPQLQYDGVYRAPVSVNGTLSWKYFRFYPDGTFITVRSVGTPEQLRQWFVRDEPNNERGSIKFQGTRLLFFAPDGSPAVYDGSMEAGQVVINTRGKTGQNQHSDVYEFVRWPAGGGLVPAATAQNR